MADAKQPQQPAAGKGIDSSILSPNTITAKDYQAIKAEHEELIKKQEGADNEFMFRHYGRLVSAMNKSLERAAKANLVFERKEQRAHAKQKREGFRQARKRAKEG